MSELSERYNNRCLHCGNMMSDEIRSYCGGECEKKDLKQREEWEKKKKCVLCGGERYEELRVCYDCGVMNREHFKELDKLRDRLRKNFSRKK